LAQIIRDVSASLDVTKIETGITDAEYSAPIANNVVLFIVIGS
jgi:hypothetical protein